MAQIKTPLLFSPVPFTGQTLAVMGIGAFWGSREGAWASVLYLLEGILGFPVFAGGKAGLFHLLGPTGGYLLGYPLLAFLTGYYLERQKEKSLGKTMIVLFLFNCLQALGGMAWLALFVGFERIWIAGFYPFALVEFAKVMIVATYWRFYANHS
jgi:biotin transport system substrate-specific component